MTDDNPDLAKLLARQLIEEARAATQRASACVALVRRLKAQDPDPAAAALARHLLAQAQHRQHQ